jgi:hypothetical protein
MNFKISALLCVLACLSSCDLNRATDPAPLSPPAQDSGAMHIGTNLWNFGWGNQWNDYVVAGTDWATASNPWLPAFLADLAPYNGPIRFQDWDHLQNNNIINWSDRRKKTDNHRLTIHQAVDPSIKKYVYGQPAEVELYTVAYEWMIDLCNRTNKDMWLCVPTFSSPAYWHSLATLIKDTLNPNLRVYLEYSNETWNGSYQQCGYTQDQGIALGLPGDTQWSQPDPTNAHQKYYKGGSWSVYHSLQIFKAFQEVFGVDAMGTRIIRVIAFSGVQPIADEALKNVVYDGGSVFDASHYNPTWNPFGQKPDLLAIAPYIGPNDNAAGNAPWPKLDGAAANMPDRFKANVDWVYANTNLTSVQRAVPIAAKYNLPLSSYEGGQQLDTNADAWSKNPSIYDAYTYMLNKWAQARMVVFCHYTMYGQYASSGAWGAKENVNTPLANAPKYRALVDWINAHP